jgi:hypothetical protein
MAGKTVFHHQRLLPGALDRPGYLNRFPTIR